MSVKNPQQTINPNTADEYLKRVIGDPNTILMVSDKKDAQGNPDEKANREATKINLIKEIDRLSSIVAEQSSSIPLIERCSKLLGDVRTLVSNAQPDYQAISGKLDEIKYQLIRAYESRKAWPKWFLYLLAGNVGYLCVIIGIISWKVLIPGQSNLQQTAYVALACALWGGLGGVVDALFALHTHFSDQDFDLRYRPWYFLHPLQGFSLGAVVFLLVQAGLLAVSDKALAETTTASTSELGITALPIAMAFLAGFKQNAAYEFIGRIVKSIFQKD